MLRGTQLLDYVNGKKQGDEVFATPLVERHDFTLKMADTINFA